MVNLGMLTVMMDIHVEVVSETKLRAALRAREYP